VNGWASGRKRDRVVSRSQTGSLRSYYRYYLLRLTRPPSSPLALPNAKMPKFARSPGTAPLEKGIISASARRATAKPLHASSAQGARPCDTALALAMSGRHTWAMANLAVTFANWGKPADAEALYAELAARGRRSFVSPSWLAVAAAAVGLEDEAIHHARKACEIRDPFAIVTFSKRWWPWSGRLLAYPRFRTLLVGTGLE
jgi:hypothetical protein